MLRNSASPLPIDDYGDDLHYANPGSNNLLGTYLNGVAAAAAASGRNQPQPQPARSQSMGGHLIITTATLPRGNATTAPVSPSGEIEFEAYGDSDLASVDMGRSPSRNRSFAVEILFFVLVLGKFRPSGCFLPNLPHPTPTNDRKSKRSVSRQDTSRERDDDDFETRSNASASPDDNEYTSPGYSNRAHSSSVKSNRSRGLLEIVRSKSQSGPQGTELARRMSSSTSVAGQDLDIEQLQRRVKKLEKRLYAAYQEKIELEGEIETMKRRLYDSSNDVDYRKQLEDTQSMTIQEMQDLVATMTKQIGRMEKANADLEKKVVKLQFELESEKEQTKIAAKKEAALSGQITHLRSEKLSAEELASNISSALEAERVTRATLEQSEAALQSRVHKLEERLRNADEIIAAATTNAAPPPRHALPSASQQELVQQLRAQILDLTTANASLAEDLQMALSTSGVVPSTVQAAMDRKATTSKSRLHVPPRISSAVKLLDHLPPGGALDEEIWKGMVAEKKESEIERITNENDALRMENAALRTRLGLM
ncbi:hypothetical protein DFJ73DRAFT_762000 [Zopfochytrium polystomum]|nr:hypothetical protein DFJ73DRAFT_762000 [Zopfochytrium polystomum]